MSGVSAAFGMPALWACGDGPGGGAHGLEHGVLVGPLGHPIDERHDQGGHGVALAVQHRAADVGDADDVAAGMDLEAALADTAERPVKLLEIDLHAGQRPALLDPAPGGRRRLK